MIRSAVILIVLLVGIAATIAAEPSSKTSTLPQNATFTGIHRNQGTQGRPETVTITDGKTFVVLSEEEYRTGGYWPFYEELPTVIVRRLPARIHVPSEENLRRR